MPQQNPLLEISPTNPEIPHDLTKHSKQHDISVYLWKLLLSYGSEEDKWFLHPFSIHFEDTASKRSYKVTRGKTTKTLEGISKLHTFDRWTNQDWQGADTLIGFFCTWTKDWSVMRAEQWRMEPWHAFGAVLRVDEGSGGVAELLIWDPATAERVSGRRVGEGNLLDLIEMQQRLFDHCAERFNVTRVWLGGVKDGGGVEIKEEMEEMRENEENGTFLNDEECMKLTGLWIHDCLRDFKATLPRSGDDLRALNYRLLRIEN